MKLFSNQDQVQDSWNLPSFLLNPDPKIYGSNNYVVFDLETTNRSSGSALDDHNRIVLNTWKLGTDHKQRGRYGNVQIDSGPGFSERFVDGLQTADFCVCQNGKFELQWLIREGIDVSKILVWDTMIAEYVRLGNRRGPKDLDSLLEARQIKGKNRLVKILIHSGVCPSLIPKSWLSSYGAWDTASTELLFLAQREELKEFWPHIFTRCLLTPVLADIEKNGMQLDPERVYGEYTKEKDNYDRINSQITARYPTVNFDSPKQLGTLLYDDLGFAELTNYDGSPQRTAAGGRLTGSDIVKALQAKTESQREFKTLIEARFGPDAALTYLEKMKACCDEAGGFLRAKYNQTVTQNHRLSSSGLDYKLQFQNFPRAYKKMFKARHEGWLVAEADGMGMEFRVGIHLGRDRQGLEDIRNGKDVHRATASVYEQKSEDSVTSAERQTWKPETFRPMYYSFGQTDAQKKYAEYFHNRYSDLFKAQTEWTFQVLRDKKLKTEWGLVFYWPDCSMSKSGYVKYSTNIANYPISCLATGEIIPIGVIYVWHMMRAKKMLGFIINTVHDSVMVEIPPAEIEDMRQICNEALTTRTYQYLRTVYGMKMTVPLGVEFKVGTHWGEKLSKEHEWKYELEPNEVLK